MEHSASVVGWFYRNVDLSPETGSKTSQSKINLKQWVPKLGPQLKYLFRCVPKLVAKAPIVNYIFSSSGATATKFWQSSPLKGESSTGPLLGRWSDVTDT